MSASAIERVLSVAAATEGATEHPPNTNAGPFVERVLKRTGLGKGNPWCAALVADVGVLALGAAWPLPKTASCYQLGAFADAKGVLETEPAVGDVFLLHYPSLKRFAHTGFVTGVKGRVIETIEGNTSGAGAREGWGVFRRTRTLGALDRVIRWTTLLDGADA